MKIFLMLIGIICLFAVGETWSQIKQFQMIEPAPNVIQVVPDVRGYSREQAENKLHRVGLRSEVNTRPSSQPSGTVIGQEPSPGSPLDRSQPITLIVAQ